MTERYIVWLDATDAEQYARRLGGKALALAKLYQIGAPVPRGFVLLPRAFTDSLSEFKRQFSSDSALSLIPSRLSGQAAQALQQALAKLCPMDEPVAVRSSAIEEDGARYSFAGQLESFLGVLPAQAPSRVIDVWRSAFSPSVA